ncbi:hypothetical protein [Agromyces larvae]|uniref:Uncharacterized protein n=1 Tax=Agromyces larvae TaxID=2929802 RepID=A0ABY4BV93_9MICO|nr:hypothetical protein [Agromyces larvae]UOE43099.1 hypothetical protein MTO99_12980 [Agromyces larvae]
MTEEEYVSAFERFSDCMTASGNDLFAVEKKDYLITFSYSGDAASDGSYQRCYVAEFEQVDTEWQLANYGASESAEFLRACLESRGIVPVDRAEDLAPQAEMAGIDLKDCAK